MKANTIRTKALTKSTLEEIKTQYEIGLKKVNSEMAKIYRKYSVDGKLSMLEMQKFSRLDKLYNNLHKILKSMTKDKSVSLRGLFREAYREALYRLAYSIDKSLNTLSGFDLINPDTITAAMNLPVGGLTLNETLAKRAAEIQLKVRQTVTQGIMQGYAPKKMAKGLVDTFGGDYIKAIRVARTESARAQSVGELKSLYDADTNGVDIKKTWIASLDEKTRETHAELDGKAVGTEEYFVIDGMQAQSPSMFGIPEQDINCRCSLGHEVKGFEPKTRVARDAQKQNVRVSNLNYKEWKKTL